MAVYLMVAPSDLDRMRPLLRIILAQLTRQLTRKIRPAGREVLLMLDEFTALGRLDSMHRGIGFFRGYGIRVLISCRRHAEPISSKLSVVPMEVSSCSEV
jgi:type IV secretion system protein VirD4